MSQTQTRPYSSAGEAAARVCELIGDQIVTGRHISKWIYEHPRASVRCPKIGKDRRIPPDVVAEILHFYVTKRAMQAGVK